MTTATRSKTPARVADPRTLEPGAELPTITRTVSSRQLVQYAAVSRDFTPIHYDPNYAKSAGLEGIIIHGALKSSLFAQALCDWFGDDAQITQLGASYRGIDYPGEPLTIHGTVTERQQRPSDAQHDGDVELQIRLELRNAAGDVTTPGDATVRLGR